MDFKRKINNLPCDIKKSYRLIVRNESKLLKNKWSLIINETCINEKYCLITLKRVERLKNKLIFILN